ncbi:hypothetical protein EDC04DRAFT_2650220 [Pisolithus marmoratus]|nr:hypothetical protein EDC04DRAFT_2650220 [Pisolithus marmoratus]
MLLLPTAVFTAHLSGLTQAECMPGGILNKHFGVPAWTCVICCTCILCPFVWENIVNFLSFVEQMSPASSVYFPQVCSGSHTAS